MPAASFDCVIVGARCAGAPLATHLSRGGMKVCIVDAAKLPSDQPFSTHAIAPPGMDSLDELGVGAKVRAVAPPISMSRLTVGRASVDIGFPGGREMYCPRRSTLDPLLAEAAVTAGAELRDETAFLDVLRDGDRVTGARVRNGGRTYDVHAKLVVGADGRNSSVAQRVGAEEYHVVEGGRGGYWAYWPATTEFDRLPFQACIEIDGHESRFAFRTDGDQIIAGAFSSTLAAHSWKDDIEGHVRERLARSEVLRTVLDGGNAPVTPFIGLMKGRFLFRTPVGKGWALVGDAALHKDPTPGYGITDALRDARALSRAILNGSDAALEVYWRERDVSSVPLFANANHMGALEYGNPFNEMILANAARSPELTRRLPDTLERTLSPFDVVPAWRVLGWVATSLFLERRADIWPGLKESVRVGEWVRRELALRRKLLAAAKRRLARA